MRFSTDKISTASILLKLSASKACASYFCTPRVEWAEWGGFSLALVFGAAECCAAAALTEELLGLCCMLVGLAVDAGLFLRSFWPASTDCLVGLVVVFPV